MTPWSNWKRVAASRGCQSFRYHAHFGSRQDRGAHLGLKLVNTVGEGATLDICRDPGDYNDAPGCLGRYHWPLAFRTVLPGRAEEREGVPAPVGYSVRVDVPVDPKTGQSRGWFLAYQAPSDPPVRIFASRPAIQIFEPWWSSTRPPVLLALVAWSTDWPLEWVMVPGDHPDQFKRVADHDPYGPRPVVGPDGVFAVQEGHGWRVWRGTEPVAYFSHVTHVAVAHCPVSGLPASRP